MKHSIISSIALTGAMLLSTAAFSQTMIEGKVVSAEDLPKVQAACDTLAAKNATETSPTATTSGEANAGGSTDANAGADAAGGAAAGANVSADASTSSTTDATAGQTDAGLNAATTTSVDLAALTFEKCQKAGLVKAP